MTSAAGRSTPTLARAGGPERLRPPVAVAAFDLETYPDVLNLGRSMSGAPYTAALVLVRRGERPLGVIAVDLREDGRLPAGAVLEAAAGLPGMAAAGAPQSERVEHADITVVITTCADAGRVSRCLDSLAACGEGFETIVVENRPAASRVADVIAKRGDRARVIHEARPGLSRARNAGLRAAGRQLVAFIDDDLVVDPSWLRAVIRGFVDPDVACVTGLILPMQLETPEQLLLEQFAGFGKGFAPRKFSIASPPVSDPLFPYSPGSIGSGANTAVRAAVARQLGGFDEALGAGTPGRGGEELDLYLRLLLTGHAIAYEPSALVWHEHPRGARRLRRQALQYGVGLTAVLTKHLLFGPHRRELLRRIPVGVRHLFDPESRKNAGKPADYPRALDRLERLGMALGPTAYLHSLWHASRDGGRHP